MNRRYTRESYLELVNRLKNSIPDLSLTTDIIVGFPGETYEDVQDTINMVREVGYDNAFTFIYSKRTGTPAAAMENQVSEEDVKKHFDMVLQVVQETARKQVSKFTGQVAEVLVEDVNEHDPALVSGRMSNNLLVHFPGDKALIGQLVNVKLVENKGFYYIGEQV